MRTSRWLSQVPALIVVAVAMLSGWVTGAGESLAFLPLLGAVAGGVAKRVFGGAVRRTVAGAARRAGRAVAQNPGTAVTIAGTLGAGLNPFGGGGNRFQGGGPRPMEGPIGRGISRMLPGGLSGREFTPFEGTEVDRKTGYPIAVYPAKGERYVAPRGYVIVYPWATATDRGEAIAMLKGPARALNLWSAPPRPPISGYDARAIRRAASATKRVKKLATKVGFTCVKKGRGK